MSIYKAIESIVVNVARDALMASCVLAESAISIAPQDKPLVRVNVSIRKVMLTIVVLVVAVVRAVKNVPMVAVPVPQD